MKILNITFISRSNESKYSTLKEAEEVKPVKQQSRLSILRAGIVPDGVHDYDKENWHDVFQVILLLLTVKI